MHAHIIRWTAVAVLAGALATGPVAPAAAAPPDDKVDVTYPSGPGQLAALHRDVSIAQAVRIIQQARPGCAQTTVGLTRIVREMEETGQESVVVCGDVSVFDDRY